MKRFLRYILLSLMCLSLVACGKDVTSNKDSEMQEEQKRLEAEKPYDVPRY